ncbi:unnamed protein product [Microthlaspi erraticum]|uniref:Uncharacterized protein n=1 Tax=Microthlaspi erraticum TaxID=1685480 RepID=A0A6D2K4K2_9BRAS|nr:unnamed protein product [Microthlaspi erraticum]
MSGKATKSFSLNHKIPNTKPKVAIKGEVMMEKQQKLFLGLTCNYDTIKGWSIQVELLLEAIHVRIWTNGANPSKRNWYLDTRLMNVAIPYSS